MANTANRLTRCNTSPKFYRRLRRKTFLQERRQVADYIHFAQLDETIEPAIKDKFEYLFNQLQKLQAT